MFLTENFVCFYSNILGFNTKVEIFILTCKKTIPITDVIKITKKKALGLFPNSIEIKTGDKTYYFTSFTNREIAYKSIIALWKNVSPHAEGFESQSEDEEDDGGPSATDGKESESDAKSGRT